MHDSSLSYLLHAETLLTLPLTLFGCCRLRMIDGSSTFCIVLPITEIQIIIKLDTIQFVEFIRGPVE